MNITSFPDNVIILRFVFSLKTIGIDKMWKKWHKNHWPNFVGEGYIRKLHSRCIVHDCHTTILIKFIHIQNKQTTRFLFLRGMTYIMYDKKKIMWVKPEKMVRNVKTHVYIYWLITCFAVWRVNILYTTIVIDFLQLVKTFCNKTCNYWWI